ncbi:MAG: orotate phosphoribosyltransferase [Candidatus Moranbacteria bacterium]|nr:orotate phosphoribosyltransferase [Candidatus Moranbacteria bacterium]
MNNQEIAEILLEEKAVLIQPKQPFTFTSGMISPIYVDNRILISMPSSRKIITDKLKARIEAVSQDPDLVLAGTATAAIPWTAFLAQDMNLPMVYVRPEKKQHGAGKQVEGKIKKGAKVVVVEDMLSTGGSSISSAQALKQECQAQVLAVVVIYSHELKVCKENFSQAKLEAHYLVGFDRVLDQAYQKNYITEQEKKIAGEWKELGFEWAKRYALNN